MRRFLTLTILAAVLAAAPGLLTSHGYVSAQTPPAGQNAKNEAPAPATGAAPQSTRAYLDGMKKHPWSIWGGILAAFLVVAAGGVVLFRTIQAGNNPMILRLTPSFFFWLGMIYTGLLLLMAAVYNLTKDPGAGATVFGGIVPIAVPWFGALGAVTISLEGVFAYNNQWDNKFNYWHIGRPIFGAVLGIVAFFLFVVIVSAAGTAPKFLDGGSANAKDYIIFYVVAFLVGYREETFRELIKRATDLVLKPSPPAAAAPVVTFKVAGATPPQIACPPVGANPNSTVTVDVHNTGTAALTVPTVAIAPVAPTPAGVFALANDRVTGGGDLPAGQGRNVDIVFTPGGGPGPFAATLTVSGTNLTTGKTIRVTG